jgi:hypothetical protein
MSYGAALALTVAVDVPLYVAGLLALRLAAPARALLVALGVNLLTHPVLWLVLADGASPTGVLIAEACVCVVEALVIRAVVGRGAPLALLLAIGANAASFAVGLVVSAVGG